MKNNKQIGSISQSRNIPNPNQNFSNYYNPSNKFRTPNMNSNTLSPPPGLMTGSNITKFNFQNTKSKFNQDSKLKNIENNNLSSQPGSRSNNYGNFNKPNQQKKEFVTMQQALGFLNYINVNQNDAFKVQNLSLQQVNNHSQNLLRNKTPKKPQTIKKYSGQILGNQKGLISQNSVNSIQLNELNQQQQSHDGSSLTQTKKKLNKNRAIKRIIQTAFDILQKNYHFTSNQHQLSQQQRSTSTQFNIYLKQYNRIIQQINSKQFQQIQKSNKLYDQNQDQLQQVFQYTVMQDFRQKLSVMFNKQKVSKNNVTIMITAFRQALISLKLNQLKVEFIGSQQSVKTIKMTQIENVQYYTHPYIFIVLTINKDKTKSKQHLYLKFASQENQDKWDRALYCCFMSRKMNKKQKLFQIQFPVQDVMKKEKQQFKKDQQIYQFNDELHIIDKCFKQQLPAQPGRSTTSNNHITDGQGQNNMLSDRPDYMNLNKNRNFTQQKIIISHHGESDQMRRTNTAQNKSKFDTPFRNIQMNTNMKKSQNKVDHNMQGSAISFGGGNQSNTKNFDSLDQNGSPIKKQGIFIDQSQQSGNLSKKSTFNNNPITNNQPNTQRAFTSPVISPVNSDNVFIKSSTNPFMKLLKIAEQQSQKQKQKQKFAQQKNRIQSPQQTMQQQKILNQKIKKLKKIRQLQKSNVRGIVCQKQRFFMNKQKIVFFYDQSLVNSSRKLQTVQTEQQSIQKMRNITSRQIQQTKYIQYWDYDYKKDMKQYKKLISLLSITSYQLVPSQLGQSTTSLVIIYDFINSDKKVDKKQLRLIFANPINNNNGLNNNGNISKAYQVIQWIKLIKEI